MSNEMCKSISRKQNFMHFWPNDIKTIKGLEIYNLNTFLSTSEELPEEAPVYAEQP